MKKLFQVLFVMSTILIFSISAAQAQDKEVRKNNTNIDRLLDESGSLPNANADVSVLPASLFEIENCAVWDCPNTCESGIAPPILADIGHYAPEPPQYIKNVQPVAPFITIKNTGSRYQENTITWNISTVIAGKYPATRSVQAD